MRRAEIFVNGLVQGVGFRYFVVKRAEQLGLKGFTKNLAGGEVYTVAEGDAAAIDELFNIIKIGPSHASVKNAVIKWGEYKNEFKQFEVRY